MPRQSGGRLLRLPGTVVLTVTASVTASSPSTATARRAARRSPRRWGWNSCNSFGRGITEVQVRQAADAMVSSDIWDADYRYVVVTGVVSARASAKRRLAALIAELASPWTAREESRPGERRGHDRLHAEGGRPSQQLVFTDRAIATLVILRFQLPHAALAGFYGVDRSTVARAVHEIRPLLAARVFAVPGEAGLRLYTLADAFAHATAKGVEVGTAPRYGSGIRRRAAPGLAWVRVRRDAAELQEGHRHHRRTGPPSVDRYAPAGPHARSDGGQDRGDRGPLRAIPLGQDQGGSDRRP